ncbi:chemotaxis protein CheA [Planomonospora parontospora subsp. parontospora]|uniref:histidine kinase n=2 Tax=Planomonospora parontospora TaxID=58119 RepID=A0AA37F8B5_9ACTN|nr:chemotaxis protein CheW [Planomonospora parontospora]GGK96582.1 chemotaxis protein CheA [Planomonospora parontospora]GII12777.1 chemotaxis protein CheA [Planomonospora parontospora subsp. parontospora]
MDELGDIIQEFLVESHENLDQLDRDLVALEQDPGSREMLSSIFRTIHTIKGTSGFLAFHRLETLTHAGESLLSRLRDGAQRMNPASADALLAMVDTVRTLLGSIEESGGEGDVDVEPVIAMVAACIEDPAAPKPAQASAPAPKAEPRPAEAVESAEPTAPVQAPEQPEAAEALAAEVVESVETAEAVPARAAKGQASDEPTGQNNKRSIADSSIRVDVDLLDTLMRLVGELVLTRNQIVRGVSEISDPALVRTTQRLNLITSELQESVMKTRMQPIDHIWSKLPRVVRDLSGAMGKQVKLAMEGKETELDRSLLEAVKDPLTHLVRNAVDHGIETSAERVAKGKDPQGTLTLRAAHEGGHVVVEIKDDGAGIDVDRVAQTALDRGVVTRDQLSRMDSREIIALVFRPGFSTAKKVTNVSGRGVGMDVVKTNIEQIGGAVDVDSTLGAGTTWRLTIPLTLAIIQALTVECGAERYAIPQVGVDELVFVDGQSGQTIEHVSGAPVYRLRGKLLPLVRLDETLGLPVRNSDRDVYIAVLQADGRRFGLVVDRVLNTEEIVVKPLSGRMKDVGVYAGSTIVGDGKVALILDIPSLARRAHLAAEAVERAQVDQADSRPRDSHIERLLIAGIGERRVAIPLDMVTRLEEFPVQRIERVGSREVVQYRDHILPVIRLASLLGCYDVEEGETVPAVVYTERGRSVALVVQQIVDIVEDHIESRSDLDDDGLTGSAVIQQRVTELLDVRRAILAADPRFYAEMSESMVGA